MARYIKLRRMPQARQAVPNQGYGFRLKIQAVEASGLPLEIFGHQRLGVDPHAEVLKDEFIFVCSAFDLTNYPIDEPDSSQSPAYFRKDTVDVVLPAQITADEMWEAIRTEVCTLIAALNAMDVLVVEEDYVCGEQDSEESE